MLTGQFLNFLRQRTGRALGADDADFDAAATLAAGLADGVIANFVGVPSSAPVASEGAASAADASGISTGATDVVVKAASSSAQAAALTIAEGETAEIAGASSRWVVFTGVTGTLKLDDSLHYTGHITGLAGTDGIDLADVNFGIQTQVTFLGDTNGGTLTITDGVHTANIALEGNYLSSTWTLSSDGQGGTVVVDPVASGSWQTLKVGAGGFIRNFDIASDGTMVGRTDTYGAYRWDGTQWVQLVTSSSMPAAFVAANFGSTGQGVYEIQIANSNTQIFYMMYDGYVFKSTNQGATWTQTSLAQVVANPNSGYAQYGPKMAIDPNNANIVYVGSSTGGLFVTKDGGATWQAVTQVPASTSDITGLLFDPGSGGVVNGVTQTIFAESNGNGVYRSTDGGATWKLLSGGPTTVANAAVASNGDYFAVDGTDLWKFSNGVWTKLPISSSAGAAAVAINPLNEKEIVVVSPAGYLDVSYDGGATWTGTLWNTNYVSSTDIPWLQAGNTAASGNFLCIGGVAFNPLVPNQLIASAGTGFWNATIPTSMAGWPSVTWVDQSAGIEQLVANQILVPPGGKPILASWDRPFFYVDNVTAYPSTYGPVASAVIDAGWSVDYASSTPTFIAGLIDHGKAVYSTDGGQTWKDFASLPSFPAQANGGTIAASTPQNIIMAPADGVQPYYTLDGGATWKPVTLPGVTDWSNFEGAYYLDERSITADRVLSNTFYLYFPGNGVFKTTDGGASWTLVYNGNDGFGTQWNGYITPFNWYNNELMSVPGQAANLFFTGGQQSGDPTQNPFMRSTNGGATWTAVANVLNVSCFGFGAPATAGGYPAIYIVGYVNNVYGIWQSVNNAQSWTQIGTYPEGSLDTIKTISGDPNIYGQVYVGFMGSGYAVLTASSASGPTISSITDSPATGNLNAGNTVTLTLTLSSAVTVAGGTPTLTLNDGGVATYTGGSGTGALTFSYTVAAGQNTSSLSATAVNLNGATVADSGGNAANLSLSGITQAGPQIDTTAPTVSSVAASGTGITSGSGNLTTGNVVTLTLNLSEAVTIAGGTPTLTLNDGGVATYTGGSGSNALTFSYTVAAGQNTSDLTVSAINLNSATVKDAAGNAANLAGAVTNPSGTLAIDTTAPTVSSVAASGTGITSGSGNLAVGSVVTLTLNLSEAVTVAGGTPTLTLNDGGVATYTGGSGSNALTFSYTVAAGQNTSDLTVSAINLNSATVKDAAGNAANLTGAVTNPSGTLQIDGTAPTVSSVAASGTGITSGSGNLAAGSVVTLTLNLSEAVTVAGGTPTLTLNDGGVATYTGGSGSNALTFSYTVAAGQNTSDLTVSAVNLNSATVKDAAGNAANLAGAVTNPSGTLAIDTTAPTVSSVAASGTGITSGSGNLAAGSVVTLTLNLSEAVTVAGGTPTLTLNDGGVATYTGGSGSNALTFSYTVAAGQNTSDLTVSAINLNSATVKDAAGNAANLAGAVTNPSGTLAIDTTAPTVSSVAASGTGITSGSGNLAAGSVVTLTLNLSEAVTVAGGTPTLTLNDGGVATYTGGSGSNALTFSYTVAAGQNTSDLTVSAVNLNAATVTDAAGNAANLAGAVTNPSGTLAIDTTAPTVSSVAASGTGITSGSGNLNAGDVVTLTLNLSEVVTVAGGTPTLTLNDGGVATYSGGSGSNALTFSYTVAAGQNTSDLTVSAVNLNSATVKDAAGNAANLAGAVTNPSGTLAIDTTAPTVSSVAASGTGITSGSGNLTTGSVVTLTLNLSEAVTIAGGTPTLTLNDGGVATYTGGSGSNALTFSYTVAAGQNTSDLTVTAVNLNAATVTDGAGNAADLTGAVTNPSGTLAIDTTAPTVSSVVASGTGITSGSGNLAAGSVVTLTLNLASVVTVAGGTPTLTLNDGGVATYTGGSGSNALTFSYTVAAGQNTSDLTVTAVNLNAATVTDGAGNAANLASAVTNPSGTLQIDTTAPTVSSVAASGTGITSGSGNLNAGDVVTLTLNLSEAVTVAGGTPTLTLNDGGVATYTGGSGSNALTFSYTVAAGQNTSDLTVTAVNLNAATVTDGAGNAANLAGAVINPTGTLAIDTTAPTVSSVAASGTGITSGSGNLATGSVVTLTLNLSEAVTVAGGAPTLTLNDGGVATYTGGSGSNALTFSYTVAAGQNTSDLTVTAVNLNAATVTDAAGNAANLTGAVTNPSGTLQIDGTAPTVSSVAASGTGITSGSGNLAAGSVVTLTLNLSEAVTVAGGTPTLTLNDGGVATYTGGSGSNALTFSYTVAAGQNTSDLTVSAINLNSATVKDAAGNAANLAGAVTNPSGTLAIDTTAPTVSSVAASGAGITSGSGNLAAGSVVTLTLNLSEAVTVAGGTPTLTLNDGGVATYTGGSGSNALTFSYTVAAGQNTSDLAVSAVNLNAATVTDAAGNAANLAGAVTNPSGTLAIDTTAPTVSSVAASGTGITSGSGNLAAGSVVTLTLNLSEAVTVAGGTPTLTLNDGGVATYSGGSGSNALTFSYTVAAGQNTSDLTVSAVNLNSATVKDAAGNAANLAGAVANPSGTLSIDTTAPTVSSVAASGTGITSGSGNLTTGSVVTLTLNLSEAVTVAGGTPTLTLNDGGVATYTGGSGSNALTFSYTVAAGQNTSDLTVSAVNLNSATVKDAAGNAANLAGAVTNPSGTLAIDTTAPTVSSVAASGTGITSGSGNLNAGDVVTLTLNLSEAVTIAGGTPTLTLNDGGVATYTGGSGSNALTFSYTVAAGQNTSDLTVSAVNLNSATVKDAAGNAANLAGAVANPSGTLAIDTTAPVISAISETPSSGALKAGKVVVYTFTMSEVVTVNTTGGSPTLSFNSGGVGTYVSGSGTNVLTFSYTVQAGENTPDLMVSAVNLNGAGVTDGAGNSANLSLAGIAQGSPSVDTTPPTVASLVASGTGITSGSGKLNAGDVVTLTLNLSEAVTVAGGTPTLTLNDGGVATYNGGSGSNALTFTYTVAAGQNTSDLTVTAINLNAATVADAAGNAADLTGAVTNPSGTLQIDTIAPTVSSVVASGTGITSGSGNLTAGSVVTLTLSLSEAVTIAGGTPTLTLNDGGVATYTGGSGSNVLTFTYTVTPSDSPVSALSVTQVALGGATVLDAAGNSADLSGALKGFPNLAVDPSVVIETRGSTSVVLSSNNYLLQSIASGNGPTLKYAGAAVLATNWGSWTVIGAEKVTGGGYDVVWKNSINGNFSVWSTDSNGNFLTTLASAPEVSGTDPSLQALESTLQQDLNGDGTIGTPVVSGVTIEAFGSTSVVQAGGKYYLDSIATSTGPTLKFGGAAVIASNWGSWTVIAAEQVSGGGYDVVWKSSINGHYSVWGTDTNGNYVTTLGAAPEMLATDPSLQALESTLQQDLNGDGTIGTPVVSGVTIEAFGSTSVVQAGGKYYLDSIATSTGPTLKFGGAAVIASNWGSWTVIAAEQVSGGGYDVVWKSSINGHYSVWGTDTNGNFVTTLGAAPEMLATDPSLKALETTLQQDLNGDGTIGVPVASSVTIEALGSTSVVLSGGNYYLDSIASGTGPTLKLSGSSVIASNWGSWTVIAAEQVSGGGYDVVWKNSINGHYSVWSTDSNGSFVKTLASAPEVLGTDQSLQALEATLHQDLNGDGVIVLSGSGTVIGANSLIVGSGASVELVGAYSGSISFAGATGTLVIDQSTKFTGTLTGQLTTTNYIDLRDVTAGASATVGYSGNNSPGQLSVGDGTNTANFTLTGNYSLGNFIVSSDGNGGTLLVDPPLPTDQGGDTLAASSSSTSAWFDSIDAQLALWSQHSASAFPTSSLDGAISSVAGMDGSDPAFQIAAAATARPQYQGSLS